MTPIRALAAVAGCLLLAAVQADAASFCLTLTRQSTGEVTDLFDLELTGSTGSFFNLALLERSDPSVRRAATGTAVIDGGTVAINISKTTGLALNGYRCDLDLGTLAGVCTHHFVFPDPADGASGHVTRDAAVTSAACP
jgi:hypothetical protein